VEKFSSYITQNPGAFLAHLNKLVDEVNDNSLLLSPSKQQRDKELAKIQAEEDARLGKEAKAKAAAEKKAAAAQAEAEAIAEAERIVAEDEAKAKALVDAKKLLKEKQL